MSDMTAFHVQALEDELERRKNRNPHYSLRAFASYLKIHPSALSRILSGKAELSVGAAVQVMRKLRLTPEHEERFLVSVADQRYREALTSLSEESKMNKLETTLRESEEPYRAVFNLLDQGVQLSELVRDESGKAIDIIVWRANQSCEKQTGVTVQAFIGKRLSGCAPLESFWLDVFAKAVETRTHLRAEHFAESLNRWYSGYVVPTEGDRFIAIFEDISERKRLELELRASEARFHRMFTNNMMPMMIWEYPDRIADANNAFLAMLGFTREEFESGRILWDQLTPPECKECDQKAIAELRSKGHCTPYTKYQRHKDGHLVPILFGGGAFDDGSRQGIFFAIDLSGKYCEAKIPPPCDSNPLLT